MFRRSPECAWPRSCRHRARRGKRRPGYSGDTGGDCVEVADLAPRIAVRDSKQAAGPHVVFSPAAWGDFLDHATQ
ncbi:DUF397 domain-containing protein [Streptomyces shenzhenensis]|uniref:DUF397 domain-containing protein n=1 Tax=Streptomyces shenzhenensis TaxID=943815 RepID=A0A3M0I3K9_9ACTN|nr:DUF397 domain-containing protein [Streptomyces shenzhenensis]RMB83354.1 DUF397 domain-containing protein [Streptomyces shenzhenensis]